MRSLRKQSMVRNSNKLQVERLEERSMMAGNVTAVVSAGYLVLTGDASDNGITIDYNPTTKAYTVTGTSQGGSNTTINSLDTSVPANAQVFTTVTKGLKVNTNAGADNVVFGAAASTEFSVVGTVDINTGAGNDTVTIGRNGNAAGGAAPIANEFEVSKSLVIKMGDGNDTVDITNARIGGALVIHGDVNQIGAPAGNDTVRFPTTFTPSGGTQQNFPVTVLKKTTVLLGGGTDVFNARNFNGRGGMLVEDSSGLLTFDLVDAVIGGEAKLLKNGGAVNDIEIDNVRAGTLRLKTGNGVDTVQIRDSVFERMYIDTSGERDFITIGNTTVRKFGLIDGGRDKARLTQEPGNNLRGVLKRKTYTP
jgi:hypothetical protein